MLASISFRFGDRWKGSIADLDRSFFSFVIRGARSRGQRKGDLDLRPRGHLLGNLTSSATAGHLLATLASDNLQPVDLHSDHPRESR